MSLIEKKYRCPKCGEIYDDEEDAFNCLVECSDLAVDEIWACPDCGDEYGDEDAAIECAESHQDASTPNHMTMADRAALEQAGQSRLF